MHDDSEELLTVRLHLGDRRFNRELFPVSPESEQSARRVYGPCSNAGPCKSLNVLPMSRAESLGNRHRLLLWRNDGVARGHALRPRCCRRLLWRTHRAFCTGESSLIHLRPRPDILWQHKQYRVVSHRVQSRSRNITT